VIYVDVVRGTDRFLERVVSRAYQEINLHRRAFHEGYHDEEEEEEEEVYGFPDINCCGRDVDLCLLI
jgi:hypothetical protein